MRPSLTKRVLSRFNLRHWYSESTHLQFNVNRACILKINNMVKPYECFQSEGHVKKKKKKAYCCNKFNAYFVCLVVKIIQRWFFASADRLWPCIKSKVIETSMRNIPCIYISACQVWMPHSLHIVRIITIIVQVKNCSSLRRSCDLEWRSRSSDWEKIV